MANNVSTIRIDATLERVWDTLTRPELVKRWQYGSELITTWEIGSDIRFRAEWQGKVFKQWGKVLDIQPNSLIRYSLFAPGPDLADKPENYFIMNYVLTNRDGQTFLKIVHEDNRPGAIQEEPQGEENSILKSLKQLAETRNEVSQNH